MEKSSIEWTNSTYNPIRLKSGGFYCAKVSPACTNCYAEIMARRFAAMKGFKYEPYTNRKVFPEMELNQAMIDNWKNKSKRKLNFVSSMTDIFGEFVPDWMIFNILDAEATAPIQIFQNLTKRSTRCLEIVLRWLNMRGLERCPENMWFGFTIENQEEADKRLDFLMEIPCSVHFVSCEPLLSGIDLNKWLYTRCEMGGSRHMYHKIDWVIVGGESGNKKEIRPMHPSWAFNIQIQCETANIPFFFKQWGQWQAGSNVINKKYVGGHIVMLSNGDFVEWDYKLEKPYAAHHEFVKKYTPNEWNSLSAEVMSSVGKHAAGRLLEGKTFSEFPKY